jgi:biotin synthase
MIEAILERAVRGESLSAQEALVLAEATPAALPEVMAAARKVRERFRGDAVSLCAIINAKSGRCAEDCRFCAQSVRYETGVPSYPLIPEDRILAGAESSADDGAAFFCIVTSGRRATPGELEEICRALRKMRDAGRVRPCASLGTLELQELIQLRESGLARYHHNIETARSFYESICTTHAFDVRERTVRNVKEAGLQVCCGGILGLGESMAQRIEMAVTLRDLQVDSIPLNFLHPIPGTPLAEDAPPLAREEILATVAIFRLINPTTEIRACAGRQEHLQEEQGQLLDAGIDGLLTGDYLTTAGVSPEKDRDLVSRHGLKVWKGPE